MQSTNTPPTDEQAKRLWQPATTQEANQTQKVSNIPNLYLKATRPALPKVTSPRRPPPPSPPMRLLPMQPPVATTRIQQTTPVTPQPPVAPQMPTATKPAPAPKLPTMQNPRQQQTVPPPPVLSNDQANGTHTPTGQHSIPFQYQTPQQGQHFQGPFPQYAHPNYAHPYFPQPGQMPQFTTTLSQPPSTSAATDIATANKAAKQFTVLKLKKSITKDRAQLNF